MTIQNNFPNIRPSLLLDFAKTKRLDPRITFTRASTGTYYDGKTVAKAEENLFLQSQTFDTTWSQGTVVTVTANQTTAPDGTSTADLLAETTVTGEHILSQNVTVVASTMTFSVFAKKGTGATAPDWIQLTFGGVVSSALVNFNLTTGLIGVNNADSASMVSVGNGWYRCIVTVAATSAGTLGCRIAFTNNTDANSRNPSYAGTTTSDVFIWGAQLEQRSSVTAYTATTTQPITNYIPVLRTAAAGVPRFDHDPITGDSLGLLIEESRTNLFQRSEEFDNGYWLKVRSAISQNVIIAPDGTLTADYFYGTGGGSEYLYRGVTLTQNQPYAMSCYVKQGNLADGIIRFRDFTEGGSIRFDIIGGYLAGPESDGVFSNSRIESVGNGWYRISATITPTIATTSHNISPVHIDAASVTTGFYAWGAQLEVGVFPTSYIKTTDASATRQTDVASMTGTNFSSWYSQDEGALYGEANSFYANNGRIFEFIGESTEFIRFFADNNTTTNPIVFEVRVNNVAQAQMIISNLATNRAFFRIAATYRVNDFAYSANASTASTDTSGNIPVVTTARIGSGYNGTIKKLSYYPTRLTNSQLVALTG